MAPLRKRDLLWGYQLFIELTHHWSVDALGASRSGVPRLALLPSSSLHVTQRNADRLPIRVSFPVTPVLNFYCSKMNTVPCEPIC